MVMGLQIEHQANIDEILLLSTPMQHVAANPAVELDSRRLKSWLQDLPGGDIPVTVKELTSALQQFNGVQHEAKHRLKLLELYFQTFRDVLSSFDEMRLRMLPMNEAQRRLLAQDIMWLYLELATGYKIVVKECHEMHYTAQQEPGYLHALYRSIETRSFHAFEQPPWDLAGRHVMPLSIQHCCGIRSGY